MSSYLNTYLQDYNFEFWFEFIKLLFPPWVKRKVVSHSSFFCSIPLVRKGPPLVPLFVKSGVLFPALTDSVRIVLTYLTLLGAILKKKTQKAFCVPGVTR